jgi:membrane protease YdiL (CAAX protease family)
VHDFQAPASGLASFRLIAQLCRDHGTPRDCHGWPASLFACILERQHTGLRSGCPVRQHLVHAYVDRGQLFAHFGWVHPRRRIFWLYALIAGAAAAALMIAILHAEHIPLGRSSPTTLLYGITIGPIVEEILLRGAAFSVIYVTAASIKGLLRQRLAIAIVFSSLLFAFAHTRTMGIPWLMFFGMGTLYALLRWRSNSIATAALMHATYNAVIVLAMLRA